MFLRSSYFDCVAGTKPIKQWASIAILYFLISTYFVFLVGWLIPLGFGIYRLVRHH